MSIPSLRPCMCASAALLVWFFILVDAFGEMTLTGDSVTGIKRRRRDQSSDGVRIMAMASGCGRLKEDIESSTWRWRQEFKALPSRRQLYKYMLGSQKVSVTSIISLDSSYSII
ncbi:hypothetical protein Tco_1418233 [Tanacetum coccineum]